MVHRDFTGIANRNLTGMPFTLTTKTTPQAVTGLKYGGDGGSINVTFVSLTDPWTIGGGDGLDALPLLKELYRRIT